MEIKKINLDTDTDTISSTSSPAQVLPKQKLSVALLIALVIILGISTGAAFKNLKSKSNSGKSVSSIQSPEEGAPIKPGDVFGAKDKNGFPDEATGILEEGGINGEGTHKLLRPGGDSQTVYLTSSVLDLDKFIGFKIIVWGETFSAQKAGWLMDVGRVEVQETSPAPLEK